MSTMKDGSRIGNQEINNPDYSYETNIEDIEYMLGNLIDYFSMDNHTQCIGQESRKRILEICRLSRILKNMAIIHDLKCQIPGMIVADRYDLTPGRISQIKREMSNN